MKKVLLLLLIAAVVFSCKKNEPTTPEKQQADLAFNITSIFSDESRDWDPLIPECNADDVATQAKFRLLEQEGPFDGYFIVDVFYTNDSLYTQVLKFDLTDCANDDGCCTFTLTEFYLLDQNGDVMKAMPQPNSEFSEFVFNSDYFITFDVCPFLKTQVYVEVLCFQPHYYIDFGFFWFNITEITVREMCFFGDVCIDWWWDEFEIPFAYWQDTENLYQDQVNGIQADMPALFDLVVFKWVIDDDYPNGHWVYSRVWHYMDPFNMEDPLCIRYADYDFATDIYKVELYVYGPWPYVTRDGLFGITPNGIYQGCWIFSDNADVLDLNGDGVIDFAMGYCVEDPEYQFPDEVCFEEPVINK
ncbi:MAG: hypothetical protein KQH67_04780 [Bacteroidetes bacterium]|nr:hypothetical protein [Bacteroidota bacterium]